MKKTHHFLSQANSSAAHFGRDFALYSCLLCGWFCPARGGITQFLYIHDKNFISSWCRDKMYEWNAFSRLPWLAQPNNITISWFYYTWFSLLPWKWTKSSGPWRIWDLQCQLKWALSYSSVITFSFLNRSSNYLQSESSYRKGYLYKQNG